MEQTLAEEMWADIEQSHANGLITIPSGKTLVHCPNDPDAPIKKEGGGQLMLNVLQGNARSLEALARILCHIHATRGDLGKKWLESGPGHGVGVSELSLQGMTVDTISLSPLAPHIQPHLNLLRANQETSALARTQWPVPSDARNAIHKKYFSRVDAPFIKHQYIGDIRDEIVLPGKEYNVGNDCCGALHYSRDAREAFAVILHSLKGNGCFIVDPCWKMEEWQKMFKKNFPAWQMIYDPIDSDIEAGSLVLFGKEHPIASIANSTIQYNEVPHLKEKLLEQFTIDCIDMSARVHSVEIGEFGPAVRFPATRR